MIAQKPLSNAARNPKILFMGTSEFAVPALKTVITHEFELIGIVTQPDRRSGRGKRLTPPPIKVVAEQHNLPVYQPEKVRQRDFIRTLERLAPDVIVVAAFGQLLPQSLLDIRRAARLTCIHRSSRNTEELPRCNGHSLTARWKPASR